MNALRRALGDCLHVLAGLPQRDVDELAGAVVDEEEKARESGPLPSVGKLLVSEPDDVVKTVVACLSGDHAREHHAPIDRGLDRTATRSARPAEQTPLALEIYLLIASRAEAGAITVASSRGIAQVTLDEKRLGQAAVDQAMLS